MIDDKEDIVPVVLWSMSIVYFVDGREGKLNLLEKIEDLFSAAGFSALIDRGSLVAVKAHFGELGNTRYIRPAFVSRVMELVRARGGKPFLTDANTLSRGSRSNAVDHINTAIKNGFALGVPLIIADGLRGEDAVDVDIDGKHFGRVKIAGVAHRADGMIVLSHFKGHNLTGFGGALKNVGMGLGAVEGKRAMHSAIRPTVTEECIGCGTCVDLCEAGAIRLRPQARKQRAWIDLGTCSGCGRCVAGCPNNAIQLGKSNAEDLQERIAEYACGALRGKRGHVGFFNFLLDITPFCDCPSWSSPPFVKDIGILASTDPVAIDQASFDLVKEAVGYDPFERAHHVDPAVQLEHGEAMGLGERKYVIRTR